MTIDRSLGKDLRIGLRHRELRPVYEVDSDRRRLPNRPGLVEDIGTVAGGDNLGQAVIMRLLTPRGELAALGHPEYGSRLHELIGRENTDTVRDLVKLHVLEALQLEPRVAQVVELIIEPSQTNRSRVDVSLRVVPKRGTTAIAIGPFTLEL